MGALGNLRDELTWPRDQQFESQDLGTQRSSRGAVYMAV